MARKSKLRGPWDLLAILILTAVLIACIALFPPNAARIVLGLPFVLFFPGYTLCAALFPRRDSLSSVERIALSIGLSLAVVPLMGLVLNYIWEVSLYPILVSIAGFTAVMCAVAYLRRRQLPPQESFETQLDFELPRWVEQSRLDRVLTAILILTALGAVISGIYMIANPKTGERFTEFYLLGPDGTAEYLPHEIVLGATADVSVTIVNHEGQGITYGVQVSLDGTQLQVTDGIAIEDGEMWQETITLNPTAAGDDQKVDFRLYREGQSEPYHELRLWIDVRDPSVAQ